VGQSIAERPAKESLERFIRDTADDLQDAIIEGAVKNTPKEARLKEKKIKAFFPSKVFQTKNRIDKMEEELALLREQLVQASLEYSELHRSEGPESDEVESARDKVLQQAEKRNQLANQIQAEKNLLASLKRDQNYFDIRISAEQQHAIQKSVREKLPRIKRTLIQALTENNLLDDFLDMQPETLQTMLGLKQSDDVASDAIQYADIPSVLPEVYGELFSAVMNAYYENAENRASQFEKHFCELGVQQDRFCHDRSLDSTKNSKAKAGSNTRDIKDSGIKPLTYDPKATSSKKPNPGGAPTKNLE
jgi:hypothetical protein